MRAGLMFLAAGCGFSAPSAGGDARLESSFDACMTFSAQIDTCALPLTGDLVLSGMLRYDTTLHTLTDLSGNSMPVNHTVIAAKAGDVDAIVARTIVLMPNTQLRGTGMVPLALIAGDSITLGAMAVIDVGTGGAGAQMTCPNGPKVGQIDAGGAGGGGGGSFATDGGDGGNGNSDGGGGQSRGGAHGAAIAAMPPGPRGGCPGADGGTGDDPGGLGGYGGGALWLAAGNHITLQANAGLDAGGGGGGGGTRSGGNNGDAGGGGGGAAGMLWIETPNLDASAAILAANGGGGGEASGGGQSGNAGASGLLAADRANGGAGHSDTGTDGGKGGSLTTLTGDPVTTVQQGGGGGGGGGCGFVHVIATEQKLGTVSPSPQ